jgi:hypothetical protein
MVSRGVAAGVALALVLSVPAAAQSGAGVKGGLSFGNISNKGLLPGNLDTRTGAAGGIYLRAGSGIVGFGVEGLYAQRGARSDESIATAQTRLDYVDVPLYLRLSLPAPGIKPFAYAGPQISFEVRCKTASGARCPADSGRESIDYAGVIGAGIRFGGFPVGVSLEGRYVYGLRDLKLGTITSGDSYKTRTFLLLIGIGT